MAHYEKLLLSTGGGIISTAQQATQVEKTASVLIGLGGTGTDCLKEVKSAVYERLVPDNPGEPVPKYQRIQFIGVDTDKRTAQRSDDQDTDKKRGSLDKTEYFDISNPQAEQMLANTEALKAMTEFDWIQSNSLKVTNMAEAGAGGLRQCGRFMMMGRSKDFYEEVIKAITMAKRDNPGCELIVHIFSGLGGGTGAGVFLDVCYLVKEAVKQSGGGNVFGYFFLPDVNLDIDRIPLSNRLVRGYIPVNGYAAMQELDYCMRLEENGGRFRQQYKDGLTVEWKEAPVTMCHLIGASDINKNVVSNAYEYAMKVTAEYVMNFLTKPDNPQNFGLSSHLSNFKAMVHKADGVKKIGSNLNYCVIGGSCASIPMREINTYLASRVFRLFSIVGSRAAEKGQVEQIANEAGVSNLDMLLAEMSQGGGESVFSTTIDQKTARDVGSGPIVDEFEKQRTFKEGVLEKNRKSMGDPSNEQSLIARVCKVLDNYACSLGFGTSFASSVISAAQSHNLMNIIDGLIEENSRRLSYERAQIEDSPESGFMGRKSYYNQTKLVFDAKPGKKKNYQSFIDAMMLWEESAVNIVRHMQMDALLTELKKQLIQASTGFYQILARVMGNLIATFDDNARILDGDIESLLDPSGFVTPIITLGEIKGTLDEEIEKLRDAMPNLYERMVRGMINDSSVWANEDEGKIARYINEFFVTQIFGEGSTNSFANKTISEYLTMKYQTNDSHLLKEHIYSDYMIPLASRANPLFPMDQTIHGLFTEGSMTIVAVPNTAQEIQDAAGDLKDIKVNTSALKDRIYMMNCTVAVPMSAYAFCKEYGSVYFNGSRPAGTNYYEGNGGSELFNDWTKLPVLIPARVIERDLAPEKVKEQIDASDALLNEALASKLLVGSECRKLSEQSKKMLEDTMTAVEKGKKAMAAAPEKTIAISQELKTQVNAALNDIETEPTGYVLPSGSTANEADVELIRRDYFLISPAIQEMMRKDIMLVNQVRMCLKALEEQEKEFESSKQDIKDYCTALYTGVITHKGLAVAYEKSEYGSVTSVPLCQFSDAFPYKQVPLYQGYVTYLTLDSDVRGEIAAKAKQRLQEAAEGRNDEAFAALKAFGEEVTDEKNTNSVQIAATSFPEVLEDVKAFVRFISQDYDTWKMTLGL